MVTKNNDSLDVRFSYAGPKTNRVLLISDLHADSIKANTSRLKAHLNEALKGGHYVFIFGDVLDLMGHDRDPRSGKSDISKSLSETDYFDRVIKEALEFFAPYASVIKLMADGNHETNVLARHSTNILRRLVMELELKTGEKIHYGKSDGWVRFTLDIKGSAVRTKKLFYNHFNNGGKRSKGVLGADMRQAEIDADIFVTGHIHQKWSLPLKKLYLDKSGTEKAKRILHIQLGTYKESGRGQWERTKGHYTAAIGGYWLDFVPVNNKSGYKIETRTVEAI